MIDPGTCKERLERLSQICLSLPRTTREDKGSHAAFSVAKKVFVYYLNNHHGDGIVGFCCKVLPGDNQQLIASNPQKFYMPAYVGPRGWVGLRLDRRSVDWTEVKELVQCSYVLCAPKRLARMVEAG
jgi:predicted DNA-binding protein (MmcQ/YjbR family)